MSVNARVTAYLEDHQIQYRTMSHDHSHNSYSSAHAANISPHKLAKGVLLQDHEGRHLMAVLPSDNKISLRKLADSLNRQFQLMPEDSVYHLFRDCAPGAVPAIASVFNLDSYVDDQLLEQRDIYIEGGDHETLIHLKQSEFQRLMAHSQHGRFSGEIQQEIYH